MASTPLETAIAFSVAAISAEAIDLAEANGEISPEKATEMRKATLDAIVKSDEHTDPEIRAAAGFLVMQQTVSKIAGMN